MPITPKNIKFITDAPHGDAKIANDNDSDDAPNTVDDDDVSTYSNKYIYSLINHNHIPGAADDDAASPYSLIDSKRKRKIDPRSMIKLKSLK